MRDCQVPEVGVFETWERAGQRGSQGMAGAGCRGRDRVPGDPRVPDECGVERAKKIQLRITALRAADTLEDMRNVPGRCHELKENYAGQLSLDLDGPTGCYFGQPGRPTPARAVVSTGRRSLQ